MNPRDLQRKLQSLRSIERGIVSDPAWVSRTRATLVMQAANNLGDAPAPLLLRIREFWRRFIPRQVLQYARGPVFAVLSIMGVVAGGSIASVSAAEQSLPGDFLYPVKLAREQTQLIFAKSKTDKLKIKTGFVERRVKEMQTVVNSDVTRKSERITVAAESLRRDLDTVKHQLNEVSTNDTNEPIKDVMEAAKFVDKKSGEVIESLKDVKASLSNEAKGKVAEVETAAVSTGVKAVQVMIDSHDDPDAQGVITNDELSQAIQGKVDGIEDQIVSTAQKIISVNGLPASVTTTVDLLNVSSTLKALDDAATTSTLGPLLQIKNAQESLKEAKNFLQQNKFDEVREKLGDAAKAITTAETVTDIALQAVATSSTTIIIVPSASSSSPASSTTTGTTAIPATNTPNTKTAPGG